ncbi:MULTISPECIES: PaaI family thioesterase [Marinobacter]|nr:MULTISPECIES: PaaI family thioesterase [Marinobacter]
MTESHEKRHSNAVMTAWQFTQEVPHGQDLGMQVVSVNGGEVCMRLMPQSWMIADDGAKEICTGVLYSLADSASGLAVFAEARELTPIATLDLRMDYFRSATTERALLAVAACRYLTDEIAFIHCNIFPEGDKQPVAAGSATFMRNTRGQRFQTTLGQKREA